MQEQNASRTALAAAYLRAAHQILDSGPRVLDDAVALGLLGPGAEERLRSAVDKYMSPEAKALRSHVVLRSRYAEDRLQSSIGRGVSQYIIVGAGFDTFALRQPKWAEKLRIVEVDHPDTQRLKKSRISKLSIEVPENLLFGGIDFQLESLEEGLTRIGVDFAKPSFFSWLGVTMYLTAGAIEATLRCMASFPRGSEAVITFLQPPTSNSSASRELAERVATVGESFVSYFTPGSFRDRLIAAGFSEVQFLTPALSARYFSSEGNSLPNPKRVSIVSAVV